MPWEALVPVLRELHSATVIECGAFDGATAEQVARLLPDAPKVWHAFECDPRNMERCRANPIYRRPGFHLWPFAIAEDDSVVTLHPSSADGQQWTASSTICGPSGEMEKNFSWLRYREEDRLQVESRSLDSFVAEHGIEDIDLLWCDVEGAERRIIEGGRRALAHTRYLFLEVWEAKIFEGMWTYAETLAALPEFEVVKRFTGDVLLRRR